jgi:hypothetical protein
MAIVNGSLELGYKNAAWFAANPTLVLKEGQIVYLEQTGTYKIGNGVSTLSALSFLGVSSETQTLQNVTDLGSTTTNSITANGFVKSGGTASQFLKANGSVDSTTYLSTQVVPVGGTTGQILAKVDDTDYNLEWIENYANYTSVLKHTVRAGETLVKGQAVYVSGANGTNIIVSKASNTTEATSSKTMGLIAQNLSTNNNGFVITEGLLDNLNTSTATIGDPVWLGVNGALIYGLVNKPYAPAHLVFIGIVTRVSATVGEIFVKVQNGFELKEIHDVDLITTAPSNNDILTFESSTSLWKPKTVVSALGFTPYNATNPSGYITGITSGMVTTALGFTPYDASNPSGYISNVTTALGYTPANQDNTILYHSLKFFTTASTISTSGTTVTTSSAQFTATHIGMKLTILGESRIITAYISSTQVTVATAYSTNYSGVASTDWGVYNKAFFFDAGNVSLLYYNSTTAVKVTNDNGLLTNNVQGVNFGLYTGESVFSNGYVFRFSSTSSHFGTKDLGYRRNAAGVLEIFDGITATGLLANRRDLLVRNVRASSLTLDLAPFTITGSNNTLQTASTAVVGINYLGGTRQWLPGNITTQSENVWGATTYSFATSSSTITNAYGNVFNAPIAGTNCTITNPYSAKFNGQIEVNGNLNLIGGFTLNSNNGFVSIGGTTTSSLLLTLGQNPTTNGITFQQAGGANRVQMKGFNASVQTMNLDAGGGFSYFNIGDIAIGATTNSGFKLDVNGTGRFQNTLTLATGTTTIAPLKLTAGTNLTTPVNGSFEFDGTNLYFTVGGVRKMVTLI